MEPKGPDPGSSLVVAESVVSFLDSVTLVEKDMPQVSAHILGNFQGN